MEVWNSMVCNEVCILHIYNLCQIIGKCAEKGKSMLIDPNKVDK